jgi:hypothetical protein
LLIAVVGYVVFGWSWGSSDPVPTAIGAVVAVAAVGVTLYRRVYSNGRGR